MTTKPMTEPASDAQQFLADLEHFGRRSDGWQEAACRLYAQGPAVIAALLARIEAAEERIARQADAEDFIARRGYRRCDIPACNCDAWHEGHAEERLSEIYRALGERTNGATALAAIESMEAELSTLRARVAALGLDSSEVPR